jgi:hypothetical protein
MPQTEKNTTELDQQTIHDWMDATGAVEADLRKVARWGMENGRYAPEPYDPAKAYAKRLARSARVEQYTDPQGREVRRMHCFVIIDEEGQRRWRWVDITSAIPDKMQLAFQQRRNSALGDVIQLSKDIASYNDNNAHGVQLEFDFNFNEDLEELAHPTEYPDGEE